MSDLTCPVNTEAGVAVGTWDRHPGVESITVDQTLIIWSETEKTISGGIQHNIQHVMQWSLWPGSVLHSDWLIGWLEKLSRQRMYWNPAVPRRHHRGGDCLTSYKRFNIPNINNLIKVKSRDILTVTFKKYLNEMFHMEEDSGHIWKWISTLFITVNHRILTFQKQNFEKRKFWQHKSEIWDLECWKSN